MLDKRREDLVQHLIVYEGPEQFEVTFTWLMHTGQDRVHDTKGRLTSDASFLQHHLRLAGRQSAFAANSSARTTLVPMATTRPCFDFACLIAAAVLSGMR